MNEHDFAAARDALIEARRRPAAIADYPAAWQPRDLAEAYRLQAGVIDAFGAIGGWKVAAITPAQRQAMGLATPIAGALPAAHVHDARHGATRLRLADFIAPLIECEFAFELARDLPERAAGYTRSEVADAVAALRLAIEIVDPRLPREAGTLAQVADGFNNGALVVGPRLADWSQVDFAATTIVLRDEDDARAEPIAAGSGRAILDGDPLDALRLLADVHAWGRGLRRGDIVTTGSCTGAPPLPGAGRYRAAFGALGSVELRVDP